MSTQSEIFFESSFFTPNRHVNSLVKNIAGSTDVVNGSNPVAVSPITAPASAAALFASTVSTNANYLRLLGSSVAVNAGNNDYIDGEDDTFVPADAVGLTDLAGNPRLAGSSVDAGAYELISPAIVLAPTSMSDIAAAGETRMVTVTLGGDATGFSVPASGTGAPPSWVTMPATGMAGSISITIMPNTGGARRATVTFTPTGGTGTATPTNFLISQLRAGQRVTLNPRSISAVAAGVTQAVAVTYAGGATGYTVEGAPPWVTVPATTTGGNISIRIEANTGGPRTARVTLTPTGGTGTAIPFTLTIGQVGGIVSRTLALVPASLSGIAAAGETRMVAVTYTGDRVAGYTFSGAPAWVTVSATATDGNISIMIEANTGAPRTATITFTPTGGSGLARNTTFTLCQLAASANRTITLVPNPLVDVPAAGSTTRVMLTLGRDATGYSVPASGTGAPPFLGDGTSNMATGGNISVMIDGEHG